MSNTLKDLALELDAKRVEFKGFLSEIKGVPTDDQRNELEKREAELASIKTKFEAVKAVENSRNENDEALKASNQVTRLPMATEGTSSSAKTLGQMIVDSGILQAKGAKSLTLSNDFNIKTVMSSGAGYPPFSPRDNIVAQFPTRALTLLDVIPQMSWGFAAYKFPQETTFTNSAAEILESVQGTLATYPEAALAFTEETVNMQKVAVSIPVTDEQLEDAQIPGYGGIAAYLDTRLGYMVRARFESQLVAGSGSGANMTGMLNVSGIQTQAKGSDSTPDAFYKAITKIEAVGFADPTHILMHPNDFQDVRILQNTLGNYLWADMTVPGVQTMFGIPVIKSTAVTQNTGVVVDMSFVHAVIRRGVDIQLGYNAADFVSGMKTIRADIRGNLACYRPSAICTVTGI